MGHQGFCTSREGLVCTDFAERLPRVSSRQWKSRGPHVGRV